MKRQRGGTPGPGLLIRYKINPKLRNAEIDSLAGSEVDFCPKLGLPYSILLISALWLSPQL